MKIKNSMDGIVIIGALAAVALIVAAAKPKVADSAEYDVTADEIREGVTNGWYTCVLTLKDGQPAVILAGKMTNGDDYEGIFLISESDWNALKTEGYKVKE